MIDINDFDAIRIGLASSKQIRDWSSGEVTKPETINYRTLKPERDGLFCERIFGPTKDWECYCGKYKRVRYKGIICERCGVEVTRAKVRRERMGHIRLAAPVSHIWFFKGVPSRMGYLLDIAPKELEKVLYFGGSYVIISIDKERRDNDLVYLQEKIDEIKARYDTYAEGRESAIRAMHDEVIEVMDGERDADDFHTTSDPEDEFGFFNYFDIFESYRRMTVNAAALGKDELKQLRTKADKLRDDYIDRGRKAVDHAKDQVDKAWEQFKTVGPRNVVGDEALYQQMERMFGREPGYEPESFGVYFAGGTGAEAVRELLRRVDLDAEATELRETIHTAKGQRQARAVKRLKVVSAFLRSGNRPEWMVLDVVPVIPPELRPMVQLDGGRFATSDLNDLYRRVINRNNRLKRLLDLGAPDVIVRNEKRRLQEAVDSLIDNSQRGKALSRRGRRELKSLSDMLKGKKGRFRRNLLGKRVDYSGRSVIVVGPQLKLYQCGLPKTMALELYRPFVIARLVQHNYAANVKGARRLIERNRPEVWEALESVIGERPVLLNRAPTLHRLGIQAFEPILIEGSAIQLHPLVTTAFNADFDGDQMAVHVPLSQKAVQEARDLMLASKNLLKPADGEPIISPSKDMVLGVYYLTMKQKANHRGDGRAFSDFDEVEMAYALDQVEVHSEIKLRATTWYDDKGDRLNEPVTRIIDTTVGRVLFNRILPAQVQFVNEKLDKGGVKDLIADVYEISGQEKTTDVADAIKALGFEYAMRSGTTLAVADISIPPYRKELIEESLKAVEVVQRDFRRGLLTEQERNEREIEIWQATTDRVSDAVKRHMDPDGNLSTMASSGATKGGFSTISQLAGMRGLMADPSGRIIPMPIRSNFREGLTAQEYFISTHGARKGLADTALRTADAGYLTRRLVDIAQDIIINEHDCGTHDGIMIRRKDDVAGQSMMSRLYGRLVADRVLDPKTGEVLAEPDDILDHELSRKISAAGVEEVKVRSALTCELTHGICAKCYGIDMARGNMVEMGAAVGIVAAQSIGEPGTQLTLRTFHTGGVAAGGDITTGLPRVEELFETRKMPKGEAVVAEIKGTVRIIQSDKYADMRLVRVEKSEMIHDELDIPTGRKILVKDETEIKAGDIIATMEDAT